MDNKKTVRNKNGKWYFLGFVVLLFIGVYFMNPSQIKPIFALYTKVLVQIAPIFIQVYAVMLATNYFVNNKFLKKHMGEDAGIKAWLIAIFAGIISVGPIYMWYPLMHDLQSKGVKDRFIATFLYNRGIKLQWLPMLVLYFGLKYSLVVLFVMILLSIPQGIITEKLVKRVSRNNNF